MSRVAATYSDGASAVYDDSQAEVVTGDAVVLASLRAQEGVGTAVREGEILMLAAYDGSPEHFIAATWALRASEKPSYEMTDVQPQAASHAGEPMLDE